MEDKIFIDKIKKEIHMELDNTELTDELSHLLCNNNIQHTSNMNGVFVNISLLDDASILLIHHHIQCSKNKTEDKIDEIIEYRKITHPKKEPKQKTEKKNNISLTSLQEKIISFSL